MIHRYLGLFGNAVTPDCFVMQGPPVCFVMLLVLRNELIQLNSSALHEVDICARNNDVTLCYQ